MQTVRLHPPPRLSSSPSSQTTSARTALNEGSYGANEHDLEVQVELSRRIVDMRQNPLHRWLQWQSKAILEHIGEEDDLTLWIV